MLKLFKKLVKWIIFHVFAKRFVAGKTIKDVIRVAKILEKKGFYVIINILGEHATGPEEAFQYGEQYLELIKRLAKEDLRKTRISVKPSQLGLEISLEIYKHLLAEILTAVRGHLLDPLVEIDRETRDYAGIVREISLDYARAFSDQRLACQVNLDETADEIKQLSKAGLSIRLCKGTAYPGDIEDEEELGKRFLEQAVFLDEKGNRPVIATHDLCLIDELKDKEKLGYQFLLGIENYEHEPWYRKYPLKFLYWITGIKNDAAVKLLQQGAEVGIYVAYGPNWEPFSKRRWKAVPKIFWRNWGYRRTKWLRR